MSSKLRVTFYAQTIKNMHVHALYRFEHKKTWSYNSGFRR